MNTTAIDPSDNPSLTLVPCHDRVLVQLVLSNNLIQAPAGSTDPDAKIIVLACGPDVTCCKPLDRVALLPECNKWVLPPAYGQNVALIHQSSILGIIV
jgi:hypothetical protein